MHVFLRILEFYAISSIYNNCFAIYINAKINYRMWKEKCTKLKRYKTIDLVWFVVDLKTLKNQMILIVIPRYFKYSSTISVDERICFWCTSQYRAITEYGWNFKIFINTIIIIQCDFQRLNFNCYSLMLY